ncbi:ABC transporter substrate-binding protein [Maribellus sediminis]|uniref:ABC transporter substrate-binding protein n=1 Tax=Maribellus sediminis TaxID=2696285 RepID=UPI0014308875|nr:ABC transporter substrate-binding protein [Maribellus sediminis]
MKKIKLLCVISLLLTVGFYSCKNSSNKKTEEGKLENVVLAFAWNPGPENAFVYYGIEQGFFEDEGIKLEIRPFKGSGIVAEMLANESVDFGFISSDYIVTSRIKGTPISAIMTLYHESPVTIYSLKEKGITSLDSLYHKKFGVIKQSATYPQVKGMFELTNRDYSKVIEVATRASSQELMHKTIDAAMDYTNYSPCILQAEGIEVNEILAKDYGIEMAGISIAGLTKTFRDKETLTQSFINAMVKSLNESKKHSKESLATLLQNDITQNPDILKIQLKRTEELFYTKKTDINGAGFLELSDWQKTQNTLKKINAIDQTIDPNFFFENSFYIKAWKKYND